MLEWKPPLSPEWGEWKATADALLTEAIAMPTRRGPCLERGTAAVPVYQTKYKRRFT